MSSWDRMGNRPIRLEKDVHWGRNGFGTCGGTHYSEECNQNRGGNFGYDNQFQQNRWSRDEEEDESLKDLMKEFIRVQNTENESITNSLEVLNDKIEQGERNDQKSLQELEWKFERMSERFANRPTGQFQNSTQPNPRPSNNQGGQSSQWSRHEEEDTGLKELLEAFIHAQNVIDDELEMSIEVLSIQVEQNLRNDQASIKELEQKLERMNEWVENQPTGQIPSYIQLNPRLSNNQDDQGLRYQTPYQNDNNVNATGPRAGFSHGDEEEQNRNENETGADLGPIAPQYLNQLRRNGMPGATFSCVDQLGAPQFNPVRCSEPVESDDEEEEELEVENQRGNEPMVQSEDRTPNPDTTSPIKAYGPRISRQENSLEMELEELLGTGVECVVDTSSNGLGDITLEEFERMFDISTDPIVTNKATEVEGNECLGLETKVEKETVETSNGEPCDELEVKKESNQKSKGISKKLVDLLYFLTCLGKEKLLQGKMDEEEELLNFYDFTYEKPIGHGAEKGKYGGEGVYSKQWKDVSIMRETKEWNNAWAKTRMKLIVSNFAILFDDVICGNVRERDVFGSWNGEGEWGRPLFPL